MECDWLDNLQNKFEEILEKLPEIVSPKITCICGATFLGGDELAVLVGSYYASKKNGKVLIFTFDYDEFVKYCKLDVKKIILENKNLQVVEAVDESYINDALEKHPNPEMLIFIDPLRLQRQDFFEGQLFCEDIYWMIYKIYYKYKIPVLIFDDIENKSIILRRDHIPVLYDVSNWHVTQDYFDNIIFLHRDNYYYGRKDFKMMFIVEKSITGDKRKHIF